jgi:hypothetical protein
MKSIASLFIILLLAYACSKEEAVKDIGEARYYGLDFQSEQFNWDTLKGLYLGEFNQSDLRLHLEFSSPAHVVGYTSYKGEVRNVSGTVTFSRDSIQLKLYEPGDLKSDGIFYINFNPITLNMDGQWVSYSNPDLKRNFVLKKNHIEPFEFGQEIDKWNLANYLHTMQDSLGEIYFHEDGMVIFEYYPPVDSLAVSQMIRVYGGWSFKNKELFIEWKPNDIFAQRKSKAKIIKNDAEYNLYDIEIEGRYLTPIMY